MSDPLKFTTPAQWRRWLERHHDKEKEVWIAFAKKGSGKKSITYQEALDEALCFGWVDNLKKRLDDDYYLFRFVPRKSNSKWSQVNLDKFARIENAGRMTDAGRAVKLASVQPPPRRFQADDALPELIASELALHPVAQKFFRSLPPGHRRNYVRWITEAKQEETRRRRLAKAVEMLNQKKKQAMM